MYQPLSKLSGTILTGVFVMASATHYPPAEDALIWTKDAAIQRPFYLHSEDSLKTRFTALAERWKRETGMHSSIRRISRHKDYREIILMQGAALPFIFDDLKQGTSHWFPALTEITGARPVDPADAGNMRKMTEAWVAWGKENGWTS